MSAVRPSGRYAISVTGLFAALCLLLLVVGGSYRPTPAVAASKQPGRHTRHAPVHLRPLHAQGRWLLDRSGRVVNLHGFNIVAKRPPYLPSATGIGPDDALFLQRHGFTAVRFGILMAGVEPKPGRFDDRYLRRIKATVDMLGRYGIRSLLDFHQDLYNQRFQGEGLPAWMVDDDGLPAEPQTGFPGNYFSMEALERAFDNFWNNAIGPDGVGLQTRYDAALRHVAERFRHDPAVIGYDIFNEPWPGSLWQSCFPPQGCPSVDAQLLRPFIIGASKAIRSVDSRHVVFFEPWLPFDYSAPTYVGKLPGRGSYGMSFHAYCLAAVGAPETPPSRSACNDVEQSTVSNALSQARTGHDALLMTEFGATQDLSEIREVVDLADAHSIPWLEWAYCDCGDPTGSGSAEALVYNPKKPPTGKNVDQTTLRQLDEPYVQATAGTPLGAKWDPSTRVFTASWSTKRVGGGHFGRRVTTVVWLPRADFRNGFAVTGRGATLVRYRHGQLLLRNKPHARRVTIRVFAA